MQGDLVSPSPLAALVHAFPPPQAAQGCPHTPPLAAKHQRQHTLQDSTSRRVCHKRKRGLQRSGVDAPLCSSRARLHAAFIAVQFDPGSLDWFHSRCHVVCFPEIPGRRSSVLLDAPVRCATIRVVARIPCLMIPQERGRCCAVNATSKPPTASRIKCDVFLSRYKYTGMPSTPCHIC